MTFGIEERFGLDRWYQYWGIRGYQYSAINGVPGDPSGSRVGPTLGTGSEKLPTGSTSNGTGVSIAPAHLRHNRRRTNHPDAFAGGARPAKASYFN